MWELQTLIRELHLKRNQKLLDLENLHMFELEKTLFIYAPYLIKDSKISNPLIYTTNLYSFYVTWIHIMKVWSNNQIMYDGNKKR